MMKHRVLVVDDEALARTRMMKLLEIYDDFEVVAQASNVPQAAKLYQEHQPAVIFLDIQMPGQDGFSLFRQCEIHAHVVFVTAFDEHALRAFRFNALDYLLKPVSRELMDECIQRIRAQSRPKSMTVDLRGEDRVNIKTSNGDRFIATKQIDAIVAAGDYTELWLKDGTQPLSSRSLREWEASLPEAQFMRIHRSALVRIDAVSRMKSDKGGGLLWLDGHNESLSVSRRLWSSVKSALKPA